MLTLYRKKTCPLCDEVEERLKDLVLAHRTVDVAASSPQTVPFTASEVPVLVEGEQVYRGPGEIRPYLKELAEEVNLGRQFQSDACYYRPGQEGNCG